MENYLDLIGLDVVHKFKLVVEGISQLTTYKEAEESVTYFQKTLNTDIQSLEKGLQELKTKSEGLAGKALDKNNKQIKRVEITLKNFVSLKSFVEEKFLAKLHDLENDAKGKTLIGDHHLHDLRMVYRKTYSGKRQALVKQTIITQEQWLKNMGFDLQPLSETDRTIHDKQPLIALDASQQAPMTKDGKVIFVVYQDVSDGRQVLRRMIDSSQNQYELVLQEEGKKSLGDKGVNEKHSLKKKHKLSKVPSKTAVSPSPVRQKLIYTAYLYAGSRRALEAMRQQRDRINSALRDVRAHNSKVPEGQKILSIEVPQYVILGDRRFYVPSDFARFKTGQTRRPAYVEISVARAKAQQHLSFLHIVNLEENLAKLNEKYALVKGEFAKENILDHFPKEFMDQHPDVSKKGLLNDYIYYTDLAVQRAQGVERLSTKRNNSVILGANNKSIVQPDIDSYRAQIDLTPIRHDLTDLTKQSELVEQYQRRNGQTITVNILAESQFKNVILPKAHRMMPAPFDRQAREIIFNDRAKAYADFLIKIEKNPKGEKGVYIWHEVFDKQGKVIETVKQSKTQILKEGLQLYADLKQVWHFYPEDMALEKLNRFRNELKSKSLTHIPAAMELGQYIKSYFDKHVVGADYKDNPGLEILHKREKLQSELKRFVADYQGQPQILEALQEINSESTLEAFKESKVFSENPEAYERAKTVYQSKKSLDECYVRVNDQIEGRKKKPTGPSAPDTDAKNTSQAQKERRKIKTLEQVLRKFPNEFQNPHQCYLDITEQDKKIRKGTYKKATSTLKKRKSGGRKYVLRVRESNTAGGDSANGLGTEIRRNPHFSEHFQGYTKALKTTLIQSYAIHRNKTNTPKPTSEKPTKPKSGQTNASPGRQKETQPRKPQDHFAKFAEQIEKLQMIAEGQHYDEIQQTYAEALEVYEKGESEFYQGLKSFVEAQIPAHLSGDADHIKSLNDIRTEMFDLGGKIYVQISVAGEKVPDFAKIFEYEIYQKGQAGQLSTIIKNPELLALCQNEILPAIEVIYRAKEQHQAKIANKTIEGETVTETAYIKARETYQKACQKARQMITKDFLQAIYDGKESLAQKYGTLICNAFDPFARAFQGVNDQIHTYFVKEAEYKTLKAQHYSDLQQQADTTTKKPGAGGNDLANNTSKDGVRKPTGPNLGGSSGDTGQPNPEPDKPKFDLAPYLDVLGALYKWSDGYESIARRLAFQGEITAEQAASNKEAYETLKKEIEKIDNFSEIKDVLKKEFSLYIGKLEAHAAIRAFVGAHRNESKAIIDYVKDNIPELKKLYEGDLLLAEALGQNMFEHFLEYDALVSLSKKSKQPGFEGVEFLHSFESIEKFTKKYPDPSLGNAKNAVQNNSFHFDGILYRKVYTIIKQNKKEALNTPRGKNLKILATGGPKVQEEKRAFRQLIDKFDGLLNNKAVKEIYDRVYAFEEVRRTVNQKRKDHGKKLKSLHEEAVNLYKIEKIRQTILSKLDFDKPVDPRKVEALLQDKKFKEFAQFSLDTRDHGYKCENLYNFRGNETQAELVQAKNEYSIRLRALTNYGLTFVDQEGSHIALYHYLRDMFLKAAEAQLRPVTLMQVSSSEERAEVNRKKDILRKRIDLKAKILAKSLMLQYYFNHNMDFEGHINIMERDNLDPAQTFSKAAFAIYNDVGKARQRLLEAQQKLADNQDPNKHQELYDKTIQRAFDYNIEVSNANNFHVSDVEGLVRGKISHDAFKKKWGGWLINQNFTARAILAEYQKTVSQFVHCEIMQTKLEDQLRALYAQHHLEPCSPSDKIIPRKYLDARLSKAKALYHTWQAAIELKQIADLYHQGNLVCIEPDSSIHNYIVDIVGVEKFLRGLMTKDLHKMMTGELKAAHANYLLSLEEIDADASEWKQFLEDQTKKNPTKYKDLAEMTSAELQDARQRSKKCLQKYKQLLIDAKQQLQASKQERRSIAEQLAIFVDKKIDTSSTTGLYTINNSTINALCPPMNIPKEVYIRGKNAFVSMCIAGLVDQLVQRFGQNLDAPSKNTLYDLANKGTRANSKVTDCNRNVRYYQYICESLHSAIIFQFEIQQELLKQEEATETVKKRHNRKFIELTNKVSALTNECADVLSKFNNQFLVYCSAFNVDASMATFHVDNRDLHIESLSTDQAQALKMLRELADQAHDLKLRIADANEAIKVYQVVFNKYQKTQTANQEKIEADRLAAEKAKEEAKQKQRIAQEELNQKRKQEKEAAEKIAREKEAQEKAEAKEKFSKDIDSYARNELVLNNLKAKLAELGSEMFQAIEKNDDVGFERIENEIEATKALIEVQEGKIASLNEQYKGHQNFSEIAKLYSDKLYYEVEIKKYQTVVETNQKALDTLPQQNTHRKGGLQKAVDYHNNLLNQAKKNLEKTNNKLAEIEKRSGGSTILTMNGFAADPWAFNPDFTIYEAAEWWKNNIQKDMTVMGDSLDRFAQWSAERLQAGFIKSLPALQRALGVTKAIGRGAVVPIDLAQRLAPSILCAYFAIEDGSRLMWVATEGDMQKTTEWAAKLAIMEAVFEPVFWEKLAFYTRSIPLLSESFAAVGVLVQRASIVLLPVMLHQLAAGRSAMKDALIDNWGKHLKKPEKNLLPELWDLVLKSKHSKTLSGKLSDDIVKAYDNMIDAIHPYSQGFSDALINVVGMDAFPNETYNPNEIEKAFEEIYKMKKTLGRQRWDNLIAHNIKILPENIREAYEAKAKFDRMLSFLPALKNQETIKLLYFDRYNCRQIEKMTIKHFLKEKQNGGIPPEDVLYVICSKLKDHTGHNEIKRIQVFEPNMVVKRNKDKYEKQYFLDFASEEEFLKYYQRNRHRVFIEVDHLGKKPWIDGTSTEEALTEYYDKYLNLHKFGDNVQDGGFQKRFLSAQKNAARFIHDLYQHKLHNNFFDKLAAFRSMSNELSKLDEFTLVKYHPILGEVPIAISTPYDLLQDTAVKDILHIKKYYVEEYQPKTVLASRYLKKGYTSIAPIKVTKYDVIDSKGQYLLRHVDAKKICSYLLQNPNYVGVKKKENGEERYLNQKMLVQKAMPGFGLTKPEIVPRSELFLRKSQDHILSPDIVPTPEPSFILRNSWRMPLLFAKNKYALSQRFADEKIQEFVVAKPYAPGDQKLFNRRCLYLTTHPKFGITGVSNGYTNAMTTSDLIIQNAQKFASDKPENINKTFASMKKKQRVLLTINVSRKEAVENTFEKYKSLVKQVQKADITQAQILYDSSKYRDRVALYKEITTKVQQLLSRKEFLENLTREILPKTHWAEKILDTTHFVPADFIRKMVKLKRLEAHDVKINSYLRELVQIEKDLKSFEVIAKPAADLARLQSKKQTLLKEKDTFVKTIPRRLITQGFIKKLATNDATKLLNKLSRNTYGFDLFSEKAGNVGKAASEATNRYFGLRNRIYHTEQSIAKLQKAIAKMPPEATKTVVYKMKDNRLVVATKNAFHVLHGEQARKKLAEIRPYRLLER